MADQSNTPTVNPRDSRDDLEAQAVKLGLAGVGTYQNKPTVVKAIERVLAGENAADVDNEYQNPESDENADDTPADVDAGTVAPVETVDEDDADDEGDDTPDETVTDEADGADDSADDAGDDTPADDAPAPRARTPRPKATQRNQGHPTQFDEFGAPRF